MLNLLPLIQIFQIINISGRFIKVRGLVLNLDQFSGSLAFNWKSYKNSVGSSSSFTMKFILGFVLVVILIEDSCAF